MMMGLGKRSADSFYQNDVQTAEFAKRNDYLEDTGMLNKHQPTGQSKFSSWGWFLGVMLGFGKRNQNKRNNFLEDTGMFLLSWKKPLYYLF